MDFEFATATRILFGCGAISQAGRLASELGSKALVAEGTGGSSNFSDRMAPILRENGITAVVFPCRGEPSIDSVQECLELARREACDLVIGFGGGSAIDTGKAVAALLANPGDLLDYLEVVGKGQPLQNPSLPFIAIPTTAGTGAEVTRNAVIGVPERQVKVSLRSAWMLPRTALVDPELSLSLPPSITASGGSDALSQLIEPFLSNAANPLTDALCREGIPRAARALPQAFRQPDDLAAREQMSLASLFSGLVLANARLGAVHGLAGPLGGKIPAPHGVICARLLPLVFESNLRALQRRQPESPVIERFNEVARMLIGDPSAAAGDGIAWLYSLREELEIPGLSEFGLREDAFHQLVTQALQSSSMKGNPISLEEEELNSILSQAL